jgi:DNA-binding transcriptional MerR regulator
MNGPAARRTASGNPVAPRSAVRKAGVRAAAGAPSDAPAADDALIRDDLFRDGKDAGALRTIGEVARALGLRQHVLRYWEDQFPMLRPLTRAGGRRYYRPEDIALVREIDRLLHREGYTIRGARAALGRPPSRRATPPPRDPLTVPDAPAGGDDAAMPVEETAEQALLAALSVLRAQMEGIRRRLGTALADA